MLLAQPFDPFTNEQTQQKKMPFLARCRFFSQRTKRVLCNLKNRTHHSTRSFPTMLLPDNRFMLTPPQPQPWYYGAAGACYDPFMMLGPPPPPPHPMHFAPMPPHQSMPYSICVHLTSSCALDNCNHQQPRQYQQQCENTSTTESTLYSSSSSLYNDDEKEQVEHDDRSSQYLRRRRRESNFTAAPSTLTRSNSDILHDRHQQHQQRRPYIQHRWSSQNDMYY